MKLLYVLLVIFFISNVSAAELDTATSVRSVSVPENNVLEKLTKNVTGSISSMSDNYWNLQISNKAKTSQKAVVELQLYDGENKLDQVKKVITFLRPLQTKTKIVKADSSIVRANLKVHQISTNNNRSESTPRASLSPQAIKPLVQAVQDQNKMITTSITRLDAGQWKVDVANKTNNSFSKRLELVEYDIANNVIGKQSATVWLPKEGVKEIYFSRKQNAQHTIVN